MNHTDVTGMANSSPDSSSSPTNPPKSTPTNTSLREAAHKAMDAYLDAGGPNDFIIVSRADMERNAHPSDTREAVVNAAAFNTKHISTYEPHMKNLIINVDKLVDQMDALLTAKTTEARIDTVERLLIGSLDYDDFVKRATKQLEQLQHPTKETE